MSAKWRLCAGNLGLPGSWFPGLADPHIAATHHLQVVRVAPGEQSGVSP